MKNLPVRRLFFHRFQVPILFLWFHFLVEHLQSLHILEIWRCLEWLKVLQHSALFY